MTPNVLKIKKYKQNDLFRGGEHFGLNACVGMNGGPYGYDDYAIGYFDAATHVVRGMLDGESYVDTNVYPLVFLYRHGIELSLKYLGANLPRLRGGTGSVKLTHKLMDNWQAVRPLLERDADGFDPKGDVIPAVEKVLKDFVEIDPTGEAFRFPTNKGKQPTLADTSLVNVLVFAESMQEVAETFTYWMETTAQIWEDMHG